MSKTRGSRGRGRGRGRGSWRSRDKHEYAPPPLPLIRPIFDWSEVGKTFTQAAPLLDSTLLTQLLAKRVQEITPSSDEQSRVQGFCTKVATILENMILTGEGEELMLDEVRWAGSQKQGTALAGQTTADLVVLMKDVPTEAIMSNTVHKLVEVLDGSTDDKGETEKDTVTMKRLSINSFQLFSSRDVSTRLFFTSTGDKVYGPPPGSKDMKPFQEALRMIRHCRWWEEHTAHLKNARNLARLLKDLQRHVPGLGLLSSWYIELLSNCAVIPLVGDDPLTLVDSFRRVWQLLSGGLFLPGSIGIPDPCEESDDGIHESLSPHEMDELTRNAQMILQLLYFGAFQEVLGMDGAKHLDFSQAYSFGAVMLDVPQLVVEKPDVAMDTIVPPQQIQD